MIQNFNIFNEYEIPEISLCYPNRKKIGDLSRIVEFKPDLKFNSLSEISFTILESSDGISTPFYSQIKQKNKIHVDNLGWFILGDVKEENDGVSKKKIVPAFSEEGLLNYKSVNLLDGTYKFYDILDNSNTMVGVIMGYMLDWTIGTISSSLWNKYRTFDVITSTAYSFIMNDVSKAYECFFQFDTDSKTLNIFDATDVLTSTNIVLSFDNLIKNIEITEKSDEYVTALAVTGGGDLDIRSVNPVGGIFIYDYSYPIAQGMMSDELSVAITQWNNKINAQQTTYATKLSEYKTLNSTYITLLSDLSDLTAEKTSIDELMQLRIDAGISDLSDLNAQLTVINSNILSKNSEITQNRTDSETLYTEISLIVADLSISNNFSEELSYELQNYTIEGSYQNKNIIKTSSMTSVEVQEQAQELYDQSRLVLAKLSQPRYEFSIDSANFLFLKEYVRFTEQLSLGSTIRVELDDGRYFTPVLLEYSFDFYNPSNFSLTFGNRMRLDDSLYGFSDLIENAITAGNSVNVNSALWGDWSKNYESSVSSFINGSLDASKNNIITSADQEIIIDSVGLRGRTKTESGYESNQVWLTPKTLAFTKDNWKTASTAMGQITLPDGSQTYGVIGNVIVGNIIASEELIIKNENNSFKVDGSGATLVDASLSVTASDGTSRVFISPTGGFKLQSGSSGNWIDNIYLDADGNATFNGKVIATSGTIGGYNLSSTAICSTASDSSGSIISLNYDGTCRIGSLQITKSEETYSASFSGTLTSTAGTIGGWSISSTGLTSPFGDYIKADGTGKLGLKTYTQTSATFNGIVRANNIAVGGSNGYITGGQVGSGTISGGNIGGHTIGGDNMEYAYSTLKADVATLNQIIAGNVYASNIKSTAFSLKDSYSSNYYGVFWRNMVVDGRTIHYLGRT